MKLAQAVLRLCESVDKWQDFLTGKYATWAEAATNIIENGESKKHIWNVDFEEAKSNIKSAYKSGGERALDKAVEILGASADDRRSALGSLSFFIYDDVVKEAKNQKVINDKLVQYVHDNYTVHMAELYKRLLALKPYIEKGRKPNPNAKAAPVYKPAMSAAKDILKVKTVYEELLKDWYPKQIQAYKDYFNNGIQNTLKQLEENAPAKEMDVIMLDFFFEQKTFRGPFTLKEHYKKIIDKEATLGTNGVQSRFIAKNLSKLTSIVSAKGGLSNAVVKHISSGSGNLSGEIIFSFDDQTSFTVRNQVVSVWGRKPFQRFPTTFHDVVLAGGVKRKMMSEEEMNVEFAGIK